MKCVRCKRTGTKERPVSANWFHQDNGGDEFAVKLPCAYREAPLCGECLHALDESGVDRGS